MRERSKIKKSIVIAILSLMILSINLIEARELDEKELNELYLKSKELSNSIKDFKIEYSNNYTDNKVNVTTYTKKSLIYLLPNSYKESFIKDLNEEKINIICNSDKWYADYREDYISLSSFDGFFDFIKNLFGFGWCTGTVNIQLKQITPLEELKDKKESNPEFQISVEYPEEFLNGKETLKITSNHVNPKSTYITNRINYYDKETLLLLRTEKSHGYLRQGGVLDYEEETDYNITINNGIKADEFKFITIPGVEVVNEKLTLGK
jgi:hypothetical protein